MSEALDVIVDRLRRVPDNYRRFELIGADARWQHGINAETLDELTSIGLPVGSTGLYDQLDLANVSLALRLPSPRAMAMRSWSAAFRASADTSATTYEVQLIPICPKGSHEGPCSLEASLLLREQPEHSSENPDGTVTLTRHVRGAAGRTYPELDEVTGLVRDIHFHLLPDGLRHDVGFLREARLADCDAAARYLVDEATARGLQARGAFGLVLAAPYSIAHTWFEVHVDDDWVPFDPHLLNLLTQWGLLRTDDWPLHRSVGAAAWRLADREFVLATHRREVIPLSLPTTADRGGNPAHE